MFTELIKSSETVFEATFAIFDVSDRANILAINVSIESTHAGKYGAGFAIIANKIRKLSEQTKEFAKNNNKIIVSFKKVLLN